MLASSTRALPVDARGSGRFGLAICPAGAPNKVFIDGVQKAVDCGAKSVSEEGYARECAEDSERGNEDMH
jgi:hypothetical protein